MIDYSAILTINYPNSEWVLSGDSYDGLQWVSNTPKPTKEELDALWISTQEIQAKQKCKRQAQDLLVQTDWSVIADVGDPTSTPYLVNQSEFKAYRNSIRSLAVNPVANPVFPEKPTEQWSN